MARLSLDFAAGASRLIKPSGGFERTVSAHRKAPHTVAPHLMRDPASFNERHIRLGSVPNSKDTGPAPLSLVHAGISAFMHLSIPPSMALIDISASLHVILSG